MTLRVLAFVLLLPACLGDGLELGDPFPPSHPPGNPPPDEPLDDALEFDDESVAPGVGLDLVLATNISIGGYELTSTDPTVAEVEVIDGVIHLRTRAPGSAAIEARRPGKTRVLDRVLVEADTVDRVELVVRSSAVSPAPLEALAALTSSTDTVGLVYRSASGAPLDGRGTVTTTGVVGIGASTSLLSEIFERRLPVGLVFSEPGTGTLELGMGSAGERSIPIEVLAPTQAAAASLELVPLVLRNGGVVVASGALIAGEILGVDLVMRTPDGRFVAGAHANWTAPALAQSNLREIVTTTPATAGPFDVTATHRGRTVTRTLRVE